ncbi:hypothetical protein [uncultured Brevundimonas sp.]|nr:hypothetical protein [uncultured Brevundimonas sp.]
MRLTRHHVALDLFGKTLGVPSPHVGGGFVNVRFGMAESPQTGRAHQMG